MTPNGQECRLKNKSEPNRQEIKLPRPKNPRAQSDNRPHDYRATQQLWRTGAEMTSHMGWMLCAQLLFVITFVAVWAKGFASSTAKISCAAGYGLLMGLFSGAWALIVYVSVPMPGSIAVKWFLTGIVQTILLGLVTFWICRPSAQPQD